jgi:bifunctional non-homologous end joining protein LigD
MRILPAGFVPPCLPTKASRPPSGAMWLHEIKHDGFRVIDRQHDGAVFLYAFDLIELDGNDLRREPLEGAQGHAGVAVEARSARTALIEADGPTVFAHACKMGLEGIVSKHKNSTYRSGRSPDWIKSKNPAKREAEEDWGR